MNILIIFLVFFLSFTLTFFVKQFALKNNLLDIPNKRSSHIVPTPKGGGIAIVLSFYLALIIFFLLDEIKISVFYGLLGIAIVAIIGFYDDKKHIPAVYRLIIHFIAAIWACLWLGVIPLETYNNWFIMSLVAVITLLYIVWLLNLFNFMDGIDGIAAAEAMTVIFSAVILLVSGSNNTNLELFLTLLAALSGFIIWNWPPAKIFMGDVGSAFLGILIASLSLITANNGSIDFIIWIILLAVFISDATYTLLVRLFNGERIYEAHKSHTYQHLSCQYGHKKVTMSIIAINLFWLLPLAWLGHFYNNFLVTCLILAYLPLIMLAIKHRAGQHV